MQHKIMTANRLTDGEVVYLTAGGIWSEQLSDSRASADEAEEAVLLRCAEAGVDSQLVVGPYLMPVALDGGGIEPLSQRERIRARGPSVRLDLGKQSSPES